MYTAAALGVLFAALGIAFIRPAARLLGAEGEMLERAAFRAVFSPEQSRADFAPTMHKGAGLKALWTTQRTRTLPTP